MIPFLLVALAAPPEFVVGSKQDAESRVLAELAGQLAPSPVRFRHGLGGTPVLWQALKAGDVTLYPEYTGTLRQQTFAGRDLATMEALRSALAAEGIGMTPPLGFANNYAVGMRAERATALGIVTVSDLAKHPALRLGFSTEFAARHDGWPGLKQRYTLPHADPRGMDHQLSYQALRTGQIDATDVYTTDAEIQLDSLTVLADDRGYFPRYEAVYLYRLADADRTAAWRERLAALDGTVTEATMIDLNSQAKAGDDPAAVANRYLRGRGLTTATTAGDDWTARLWRHTREHLTMVGISLGLAIVVAVPLGIVASRRPLLGQAVLGVAATVQTIPALALLVVLIPLPLIGGSGERPAVVALFLYSLLPIVRNTVVGLREVPAALREVAEVLGLPRNVVLRKIELPLAARSVLAGIKTAAVINVGTATLGALIGAGGYGQPITEGVQFHNYGRILEGAIPAAVLALVVQGVFELVEWRLAPRV